MSPMITDQITIMDCQGKQIHGKVIYIEPISADRLEAHIRLAHWLDPFHPPYRYEAVLNTKGQSMKGFFEPQAFETTEKEGWLFKGTFERAKE